MRSHRSRRSVPLTTVPGTYCPTSHQKPAFQPASSAVRFGVGAGPCGPSPHLVERPARRSDLSALPRCPPLGSVLGTSLATPSSASSHFRWSFGFPNYGHSAPATNRGQEADAKSLPFPPDSWPYPQESVRCPPVIPNSGDRHSEPASPISSRPVDRSGRHRTTFSKLGPHVRSGRPPR